MIRQGPFAAACAIVLWEAILVSSVRAANWEAAASMGVTREYAGLAVLPDGNVLAVSGHPLEGKSLASAEIFDPRRNVWKPTGSLNLARNGVEPGGLAKLPSGKYLIAGGGTANRSVHEAELYDYKSGTWTNTGSMHVPRCVHAAVQLNSGHVLTTGGIDWRTEEVHASTEIYDSETGSWMKSGSMATPRFNHRAVRLSDGQILVTGGSSTSSGEGVVTAEIYDPQTHVWRATAPMPTARRGHAAIVLKDGRVLIAGGATAKSGASRQLSAVEVFDPQTAQWTALASLREGRWGPSISLLDSGEVLVVGGAIAPFGARRSAELFDPKAGTWSAAGNLTQPRNGHRAITLDDGRILFVGGSYLAKYLATCEIYVP